jgi:putative ABC transport system permease protein
MIDHASTDLWVMSNGAKCFEDLSLLNTAMGDDLKAIEGVAEVIPVVVGFSAWKMPGAAMTPVFIVGSECGTSKPVEPPVPLCVIRGAIIDPAVCS